MSRKSAIHTIRVPFLALLLMLITSCREVQNSSVNQTPTPTLIPTMPTLDLSSILAPVASGRGILEAAQYSPDVSGPHRLLILSDFGSLHEWNELLPADWTPSSVNEIELVVLIYPEREFELDTQAYIGGPSITRYRFEMSVEVREARTGFTLWEGILKGGMPRAFPETAPVEQTRLTGSKVGFADLEGWLSCRFIAPRQCEYRTLEGHLNGVVSVAFSPDGKTLASGSSEVRLWRVSDGALLQILNETGGNVAFSPDGQILASVASDGVNLWRVSDGNLLGTLETSKVTTVAFSLDGQIVASASYDETIVRLWRVSDGNLLRTLEGHTDKVFEVAFSPDGKTLASGSGDKTVRLWRFSDGTLLREMEGHSHGVSSVAFSPDGKILASGSSDLHIHLWRVLDGALLHELHGHTNSVYDLAFSPDGQTLASGSSDNNVRLWQVSDGTLLRKIEGTFRVHGVAFSPDGQILAWGSGDKAVHLWWVE